MNDWDNKIFYVDKPAPDEQRSYEIRRNWRYFLLAMCALHDDIKTGAPFLGAGFRPFLLLGSLPYPNAEPQAKQAADKIKFLFATLCSDPAAIEQYKKSAFYQCLEKLFAGYVKDAKQKWVNYTWQGKTEEPLGAFRYALSLHSSTEGQPTGFNGMAYLNTIVHKDAFGKLSIRETVFAQEKKAMEDGIAKFIVLLKKTGSFPRAYKNPYASSALV